MTELKEKKLYPSLPDVRENPSAPAIDDRGHSHRLKIITNVLNFLEKESSDRDAFSKKYFRVAKYVSAVDSFFNGANRLRGSCGSRFVIHWHRISSGTRVRSGWCHSWSYLIIR